MKEILASVFVASVLTLGLVAPAEAHTSSVRQGDDIATVLDGPATNHDRVRIHDSECDGRAVRVEAILSDGSKYTMWNFEGCGKTRVSELNRRIESFRMCEVDLCTPWKDA